MAEAVPTVWLWRNQWPAAGPAGQPGSGCPLACPRTSRWIAQGEPVPPRVPAWDFPGPPGTVGTSGGCAKPLRIKRHPDVIPFDPSSLRRPSSGGVRSHGLGADSGVAPAAESLPVTVPSLRSQPHGPGPGRARCARVERWGCDWSHFSTARPHPKVPALRPLRWRRLLPHGSPLNLPFDASTALTVETPRARARGFSDLPVRSP